MNFGVRRFEPLTFLNASASASISAGAELVTIKQQIHTSLQVCRNGHAVEKVMDMMTVVRSGEGVERGLRPAAGCGRDERVRHCDVSSTCQRSGRDVGILFPQKLDKQWRRVALVDGAAPN